MKTEKRFKKTKKLISIILSMTVMLTSVPISAAAVAENETISAKHDNPWDYTIFTNSDELNLHVTGGTHSGIEGDIHANNNVTGGAPLLDVSGIIEASGQVSLNTQRPNGLEAEDVINGAQTLPLPNIYYSLVAKEGGKARTEIAENTSPEDMLRTSIISDEDINIDLTESYPQDMQRYTKKAGAFGAGFLTKVYENPDKWADVLPMFDKNVSISADENGRISLVDLTDDSYFSAVQEQSVDFEKYSDYDKLLGSIFMNNLNKGGYIAAYIDSVKSENAVFDICNEKSVILSPSWDGSAVNPESVKKAEKVTCGAGKLTLNGSYSSLKELKIPEYGSIQLIGDYDNLEYIYMNAYGNLNLAGNFPSLKCVYMQGGQLLLGTDDKAFCANGATVINENGTITLYTKRDTRLTNCEILTKAKIAIRGDGKSESKFVAEGSLFAGDNGLTLGDMRDVNSDAMQEIPCFFSQSGISVINCNFKNLQGSLLSRNGEMVLADSDIEVFTGFLFAQNGIKEAKETTKLSAMEGVYAEVSGFIQPVGLSDGIYQPAGQTVGGIHKIEYAQLPQKFSLIPGAEEFISQSVQTKNADREYEDRYAAGLNEDEENIIYILAEGNISIKANDFNTPKGRRMIIASHKGNVTITASPNPGDTGTFAGSNFDGIIYAPKGEVTFTSAQGLNISGRVYANSCNLSGYWIDVNTSGDDLEIMGIPESFKLDDENYSYEKNLNVYYLDNSSLNNTIKASFHTNEEVEEITYAVQKLNYFTGGWHDPYIDGRLNSTDRYFKVSNAALRIGLNKIIFTAKPKYGKIIKNEFIIIFYDENNLDENDSDGDKLLNWQEEFYDTDKNNADTDGDGLNDYAEINQLGINPLSVDTDGNGISDSNEDFDGDGLTNGEELIGVSVNGNRYNTDPLLADTDEDTLNDYDEIYVYGTDPTKKDTDGDGVDDNVEAEIGSNPLTAEASFSRTVTKLSEDEKITASVTVTNSSARVGNSLKAEEVKEDFFFTTGIPGYIGSGFEFEAAETFDNATISFTVPNSLLNNPDFEPAIYYFNEDKQILERVSDQWVTKNKISANVRHFSKYIVINQKTFDEVWKDLTVPTDKPKDIMFAICRDTDDALSLKNIYETFIDKLKDDDRVGVVFGDNGSLQDYRDLVDVSKEEEGVDSLKPNISFFENVDGGQEENCGLIYSPILRATKILKENGRASADKYLIVLSNGKGSFNSDININLGDLIENNNVTAITIGVNIKTQSQKNLLDMVSGEYFNESEIKDKVIERMFSDIPDMKIDSNDDGITDYDTKLLMFGLLRDGLGRKVFNNTTYDDVQKNFDYDDDGLKNGEEIQVRTYNKHKYVVYMSDPTKMDSDGDLIDDIYDAKPTRKLDYRFKKVNYFDYEPQIEFVERHLCYSQKCFNSKLYGAGDDLIQGLYSISSLLSCVSPTLALFLTNDTENTNYTVMPNYSRFLTNYLLGVGLEINLSPNEVFSIIHGQKSNYQHYIYNINELKRAVEESCNKNITDSNKLILATSGGNFFKATCYKNINCSSHYSSGFLYDDSFSADWGFSIGESLSAMVGQAYYKKGYYFMNVKYYIIDIYEFPVHWDKNVSTLIDKSAHYLHEVGKAKDFKVKGYYEETFVWQKGDMIFGDDYVDINVSSDNYNDELYL